MVQLLANLSSPHHRCVFTCLTTGIPAQRYSSEIGAKCRGEQATAKEDEQFLSTREDADDLDASSMNGYAHAPHWPGVSSSSDDTFLRSISYYSDKTCKPS